MNATQLLQHMTPAPALARRVRARTTGVEGEVFDITDDGWVCWVDAAKGCHISKPDYLEVLS